MTNISAKLAAFTHVWRLNTSDCPPSDDQGPNPQEGEMKTAATDIGGGHRDCRL
jgi:hypothetical protein